MVRNTLGMALLKLLHEALWDVDDWNDGGEAAGVSAFTTMRCRMDN